MAHDTQTEAKTPSLFDRILFSIPVIGHLARAISKDINIFFWMLPTLLLCLVLAFMTWGAVVFTIVGLFLVPCMFLFFLAVTWP